MLRLDAYLATTRKDFSRNFYQKLIREKGVIVDGKKTHKPHFNIAETADVKISDEIVEAFNKEISPAPVKSKQEFKVIFEDESLLVVDKPSNVKTETITHGMFPVHRLDKDTTGVLVIAKSGKVQTVLQRQWQDHEVKKIYKVLIKGHLKPSEGEIDASIFRSGQDRTKMAISSLNIAREAITEYKVDQLITVGDTKLSLVSAYPQTGRTHQIRVHFASIGHPVVADATYGDKKLNEVAAENFGLTRQFLHAEKLTLKHPVTKKEMNFISPLPADLTAALTKLKVNL